MSNIDQAGTDKTAGGFSPAASQMHSGNEHPSVNLPFSVVIDGRSYEGVSVSMAAAKINGLAAPGLTHGTRLAMFRFNFGEFMFLVPIAVIVDMANADTGELNLTFAEPTGPHMPQLRYLLNAWLAGDVVNLHDILQAKSRLPKTTGHTHNAATPGRFFARLAGLVVSAAASLLFVFAASALISNRIYQHAVVGPSVAVWSGTVLRATTSGQLSFFAQNPANGQPLYTVESASGASVTTVLPCNCTLREQYAVQGATVLAGEPIVQLSDGNGSVVVEARFSPEDLNALSDTATISMTVADGSVHRAKLGDVKTRGVGADSSTSMLVTLQPESAIAASDVNKPVRVTIETTPPLIATINRAGAQALSLITNGKI